MENTTKRARSFNTVFQKYTPRRKNAIYAFAALNVDRRRRRRLRICIYLRIYIFEL